MKSQIQFLLTFAFVLVLSFATGCDTSPTESKKPAEPHSHGAGDELVWAKSDLEFEGHLITLGHHGSHFHGGDAIEPAIMITKDGADVADAKTSCSMLDDQGASLMSADMIYEPKTDEEPAHYAQGELKFPAKEQVYKIEFVVFVAGKEFKDTIEVKSGH